MNTRRMNRLEELGRVDAEKADTSKGKRNLREEKSRIVRELKADGGKVKKKKSRKNPMKDDRAREGLKSKYRKMGMGKMIDSGEIDFSEYKAGGKVGGRKKMGPDAFDTPRKKRRPGARDRKRGKFPDLTGDGKVTRADVLKGRGVFKSGGIAKRGRGCEIR